MSPDVSSGGIRDFNLDNGTVFFVSVFSPVFSGGGSDILLRFREPPHLVILSIMFYSLFPHTRI